MNKRLIALIQLKMLLDGANKLHSDQENANRQIEGLTSLNPAQITAEKQLINQATTRTDVAQKLAD